MERKQCKLAMHKYFAALVIGEKALLILACCTCHQCVEEAKEIRNFRNIIIWTFEYCLLPDDISLGVNPAMACPKYEDKKFTFRGLALLDLLGERDRVSESWMKCQQIQSNLVCGLFYVAPAPGKMGYFAAAESDGNGVGWEPSYQACESRRRSLLPRALALAPFVDRGLSWFTVKFKFASQEKVGHIPCEAKELQQCFEDANSKHRGM
ncbi:unnamed protein product [Dovyalis caffra]|uniref:Uncharacterized protein n=1 Tax=Dovyalis caffra TaxID=77055 RepID=A0AAV1RLG1_9ROSI|nr:unnamed protein product [Dovyalis caffra]